MVTISQFGCKNNCVKNLQLQHFLTGLSSIDVSIVDCRPAENQQALGNILIKEHHAILATETVHKAQFAWCVVPPNINHTFPTLHPYCLASCKTSQQLNSKKVYQN